MGVLIDRAIEFCRKLKGNTQIKEDNFVCYDEFGNEIISGKLHGRTVELDYYGHAFEFGIDAFEHAREIFGNPRAIYLSDTRLYTPRERKKLLDELVNAGIPFVFRKSTTYGSARIYVPKSYYSDAIKILRDVEEGFKHEHEIKGWLH